MARRQLTAIYLALVISLAVASAANAETILNSGPQRVSLLELYTSEGCSSCPPADRWLSSLLDEDGLWHQFVPVAFHVDYWDYIGWKDRFSKPEFGERQRAIARQGGARTVYTPGVILDGKDWRGWARRDAPAGGAGAPGELTVRLKDGKATALFVPWNANPAALTLYLAWLRFGLSSEVSAGENRGRRLDNDFVATVLETARMSKGPNGFTENLDLPDHLPDGSRWAVAAWVSRKGEMVPVQTTGGWLEPDGP